MERKNTSIELYVIEQVKKRRTALNIVPRTLSIRIGLEESFVCLVENPKNGTKYNFNHLNEIAKVLKCSVSDFFPVPHLPENCIAEYKILHPRPKK